MANTQKKNYVSDLVDQLQNSSHLVVVGFETTSHKRLEELRGKLRELGEAAPTFLVLKNSLFKIAFAAHNAQNQLISDADTDTLLNSVKGQAALMLIQDDWLGALKVIRDFAKEEEGFDFRVGLVDKQVYVSTGLTQLSNLPGRDELAVKIIMALRSSQTRLVYGLQFNTMKLVHVLKNASEAGGSKADGRTNDPAEGAETAVEEAAPAVEAAPTAEAEPVAEVKPVAEAAPTAA